VGLAALAASGLVPIAGCGDNGPLAEVTPALASCASAWQEIYGPWPDFTPPQILPYGDRIFLSQLASNHVDTVIDSVPASGGDATILAQDTGAFLWVEGSNLLYAPWGDRLQSVPLAGGTPTVLQDGGYCTAADSQCSGLLLDDGFLYFNAAANDAQGVPTGSVSFRRMSRATGAEDELALLPNVVPTSFTRLVGDSVMFVAGHAYVVPRSGGPLRQLTDSPGNLVGLDDQGAISFLSMPGFQYSMRRAPIDGGQLQPFWAGKPSHLRPQSLTPDGAGGWIVAGLETFDDGEEHASLWALDAQQNGVRAACDPHGGSTIVGDEDDLPSVFAATRDAIYAVVEHLTALQWSLVRVAR
jgi:hypothetical protein